MMTHTHMLMGAAIFGRQLPKHAWAGVAGGVIPDLPMYATVAALKYYVGLPEMAIFGIAYFHPYWQAANGLAHSFILWPLLAATSWLLRPAADNWIRQALTITSIIATSALIHSIIDFLCHREDAHSHFWPLTMWKFISPVSYWDSAHFGTQFQILESLLGLALAMFLAITYRNWFLRIGLVFLALLYVAVPAYFHAVM